jgi:hypothetical protein
MIRTPKQLGTQLKLISVLTLYPDLRSGFSARPQRSGEVDDDRCDVRWTLLGADRRHHWGKALRLQPQEQEEPEVRSVSS